MASLSMQKQAEVAHRTQVVTKINSAVFYAVASFTITVVNKTVLTAYAFPSYQVLGLGQMLATITVLWLGRLIQIVNFPPLDRKVAYRIWPLPVFYLGNMTTGLGGTKELSLPMFTALRQLSGLMTMVGESFVLGVRVSWSVQASVLAIVTGALLAAANDVTFSWLGYTLVLLNDGFTAANGVTLMKKLYLKELDKYGLMYYNALFMILPAGIIAWSTGDLYRSAEYQHWGDALFLAQFLMSCVMGVVLSYSVMLCIQCNSALTTYIISCFKNILVTYLGMVIGGDYVFSWLNFIGLNISVIGSVFYTYVTFKHEHLAFYARIKNAKVHYV